jgi:hypothetical protein
VGGGHALGADTRNRWVVRALPGYRSVQAALASAFDTGSHGNAMLGALWPMLGILAVAAGAFALRLSAARMRAMSAERVAYFKLMAAACGIWLVGFELVGYVAAHLPTHDLTTALDRLLVKQHLAVDVLFGVLWALVSWQAAIRI